MKLINRDDIERWANRFDSKGNLPLLISRLVRATTPVSTQVDFPSGNSVFIGGWDGVVNCKEDRSYVPEGISLWEFGTEANIKGKADEDYNKRTEEPLDFNPKDCVFIFVTPRFWKKKDKWITAKKKEGVWKDVRVYDSSSLEQWLEITLSVSRWFSSYVGAYPFDGIMTADEFWEEWAMGPNNLILLPEIVTSGRDHEQKQLLKILQEQPSIKGVKASTKNEAIAFIIAAAKQFPQNESEKFFSKTLIIDTEGNFRGIRINTTTPLNLIPRFEETQPLYSAVAKGHHVIIPLGADDSFNQETITLPTIDRDGQIKSLTESGITKQEAAKLSREAGRNITILKRLIGFPYTKLTWIETEDIREIIPALLLGRWNESYSGDIELLEKLSGLNYSKYLNLLTKWSKLKESPLIQIGEMWRLTSPLDLWTNLSQHLIESDFEKLAECFLLAFIDGNPTIESENEKNFTALYDKKRKFSAWSREGLTQSLILVGRFGEGLNIPRLSMPQSWVDGIISKLLKDATGDLWISVDHELPLISEASPISFLKAVTNSLSKEEPEIMSMFKEEEGFLHSTSNHTGLLWALEGLAWMPSFLNEVSIILLKLSNLDPGGNLANRPINSITEIFKPWHYQTLATFEERMEILEYVTKKQPESGWNLLIRMLPEQHGIAHPTHKMRWRIFDENTNLSYTYKEIWDTHSIVISLLIELFKNDENKFAQFLDASVRFAPHDRRKVLDWARKISTKVEQTDFITWHTLRKILHHHRSYPDTDWALPEVELKRYEDLYNKLKPHSVISKNIWLFDDHWPDFPDGFIYDEREYEKKHDQQQKKIDKARAEALKVILNEIGLKKTLELRKSVNEKWSLGNALAKIITNENEIFTVCDCLNDDKKNLRFIHSFIFRKSFDEGFEWIKSLMKSLQEKGFSGRALANIIIPLDPSQQLWDFLSTLEKEIEIEYWQNIYPKFYNISDEERVVGIKMLIKYKRFFAAMDICSHYSEKVPSEILSELLRKASTEDPNEPMNINVYQIEKIFETLDNRTDLDKSTLINLEWLYLPILDSYGARRDPKVLQNELAQNPGFFIDILKWVYKPKNEQRAQEENKDISEQIIQNRAKHGYHLLHSWKKIPGMNPDHSIDEVELEAWIYKARELAEKESRLEAADIHIGQVLAQYPENINKWPQEKIFAIIDTINSNTLNRNYSSALYNKRGSSTRGPFDGGEIERGHAKYFEELANKYRKKYPNVSGIFKQLSESYYMEAKRMDEQAERDKLEY